MPIPLNSLVAYKHHPARVAKTGEKLEIELPGGSTAKVRSKDVVLLHPGPLRSLGELKPLSGDAQTAWQILSEGNPATPHPLSELAELMYDAYTPGTAWAAWQVVTDGLYFQPGPLGMETSARPGKAGASLSPTPAWLLVNTPDQVAQFQAARQAKATETAVREAFLERLRRGQLEARDRRYLLDVEELALGRRDDSRTLRALGRAEKTETAHRLLLELGVWDALTDPYPARQGIVAGAPDILLPELPDEPRLDLTGLSAFAIDDRENQDPDDALSLEGERLWVHVADVAALVRPDSRADLEARERGANLYLPQGTVPMLPPVAVQRLGLGLQEVSPALSFGIDLDAQEQVANLEIVPSWVRVQRLTYEQAEERLDQPPLRRMTELAERYEARRREAGAFGLDLPEIIIKVRDGLVTLRPVLRLRSRKLVRESMLMAGEAAARYAFQYGLAFPYASQEPIDLSRLPGGCLPDKMTSDDLACAFAVRRLLRAAQVASQPAAHAGLGLAFYARLTSPLRRSLDLLAHQQLRANLAGLPALSADEVLERGAAAEMAAANAAYTENRSRRHWTLVYLLQNPGWEGEGVLVEKRDRRARLLIPDLALDTNLYLRKDLPLNSRLRLRLKGVDLPELEAHFDAL